MNLRAIGSLFTMLIVSAAGPAAAQTIDRVRELYIAAAYEDALAAIPPTLADSTAPARTEAEQYRALCLLALGREGEAISAVERLVKDNPTFVPSSEISPRMRGVFDSARAKIVPAVARQTYSDAKSAFDAKDVPAARAGFTRTLEIIDSLPDDQKSGLADLRLLASGFLDLSAVRPEPIPPIPTGVGQPSNTPNAAPSAASLYTSAVAVKEELPVWVPPDSIALHTEYVGLVEIGIGANGQVVSVRVLKPSHPVYDAAVIRAAKQWTYKPATRNGQPVESLKTIQLRLVPR